MNDPLSFNTIIAALRTKLLEIDGIGQIDTCAGAPSPWSLNDEAAFQWNIDVSACKQKYHTISGTKTWQTLEYDPVLMLDGWYPWSFENGSDTVWQDMIELVVDKIEANPTLGIGLVNVGNPLVAVDDFQMKSSMHQNDETMQCHYCKIVVPVLAFYELSFED